jgi:hypothetical protein
MHPISSIRSETYVAVIRLKELPVGFRVISAESVSIDSLPDTKAQETREKVFFLQTNESEKVYCVAMFDVEAIDAARLSFFVCGYRLGMFSNLVSIQEKAATENARHAELIKMLNK